MIILTFAGEMEGLVMKKWIWSLLTLCLIMMLIPAFADGECNHENKSTDLDTAIQVFNDMNTVKPENVPAA